MMKPPKAVICDVNGTLFGLQPFQAKLEAVGLSHSLEAWFAGTLRDGIAALVAGSFIPFRTIALQQVQLLLLRHGVKTDRSAAAELVLSAFDELKASPDIRPGMEALQNAGIKVATMTNGSIGVTQAFLERSGLTTLVNKMMDVEGPQKWKPSPEAYHYACHQLGIAPEQAMLVASHPWDVNGALCAGLRAAFIDRDGDGYPAYYSKQPETVASDFCDLAHQLTRGSTLSVVETIVRQTNML